MKAETLIEWLQKSGMQFYNMKILCLVVALLGYQTLAEKSEERAEPTGICPVDNSTSLRQSNLPILFHGGPVMKTPVAYLIFYGTWSAKQRSIVTDFVANIGRTSWWAINLPYGAGRVTYGRAFLDSAYSQGRNLGSGTSSVYNIVQNAFNKGLTKTTNGIYLVMTSSDVTLSGFCTEFCGWHTYNPSNNIKFSFNGVPPLATCRGCVKQNVSPNGDAAVDSVVSVVAHEMAETATNPVFNAWYDANGDENADKCYQTFPNQIRLSNGAVYNIIVGPKRYLIQSNWNKVTNTCSMS